MTTKKATYEPTPELRFERRSVSGTSGPRTAHVLQQLWTTSGGDSDWRDVPEVNERKDVKRG